jgi:hypothetical protein
MIQILDIPLLSDDVDLSRVRIPFSQRYVKFNSTVESIISSLAIGTRLDHILQYIRDYLFQEVFYKVDSIILKNALFVLCLPQLLHCNFV